MHAAISAVRLLPTSISSGLLCLYAAFFKFLAQVAEVPLVHIAQVRGHWVLVGTTLVTSGDGAGYFLQSNAALTHR
jgi:hypothetical protein